MPPQLSSVSTITYEEWIETVEQSTIMPLNLELSYEPLISVIVPAYNTPDKYLQPLIDSLLAQTYTNWQLCLVQGGSPNPDRAAVNIYRVYYRQELLR